MIEYALDDIQDYAAPPTPEMIEELRARQLKSLQAVRRQLLKISGKDRNAA